MKYASRVLFVIMALACIWAGAPTEARANVVEAWFVTSGCDEFIWFKDGNKYRVMHKCCDCDCYDDSGWFQPSTVPPGFPGGSGTTVTYNGNGDMLIPVSLNRGGLIGVGTDPHCHPFTANGSSIVVLPASLI